MYQVPQMLLRPFGSGPYKSTTTKFSGASGKMLT